ncbi:MAG: LLM class F420-dependent oxidoreductase [Pseudomonadales bacterium]|nr:LLM class F420-dependent oxidoreductase [Pseudomonadales bacterium]
MKLGLALGYSGRQMKLPMERILLAEQLGYDSVWTAETYGSDAWSPLAFIAAKTQYIRLGTAIQQLAGRPPVTAAMQAATIDALAGGGRVICGIGMSGPQIVEGWYGQPWGKPYYQVKDYVAIMRKVFKREEPVSHNGKAVQLPFAGEDALGIGKPLKSILHMNADIPIWLGTGTETMVGLTGEIADGWLPLRMTPDTLPKAKQWLQKGAEKANKSIADIEIQSAVQVTITDDIKAAIEAQKPNTALYVGGMGHKNMNFHKDQMINRGYKDQAERIQELYLAGHKEEAANTVPDEYIDDAALIGSKQRIKERYQPWVETGFTGLTIGTGQEEAIRYMAQLAGLNAR